MNLKSLENNMFTDEQINQFKQTFGSPEYTNYAANKVRKQIYENLSIIDYNQIQTPEEKLKFLTDKFDNIQSELELQTSELQKLRYENVKLNSQITTLNQTIDEQNSQLEYLQDINTKLTKTNKTLIQNQKSNKGYWFKTIMVNFIVALFSFVLGQYS